MISRVRKVLTKHPERFLRRVFTPEEVALCRGRVHELAARFAAKEAVMKALGTGARGLAWREIEVLPNRRGKPLVYLHGLAQKRAETIGLRGSRHKPDSRRRSRDRGRRRDGRRSAIWTARRIECELVRWLKEQGRL